MKKSVYANISLFLHQNYIGIEGDSDIGRDGEKG
jgi:hypothetical protein